MAVPTEDFDFVGAFAKFRKEAEAMRLQQEAAPTYVKDDFFDSMSCEALERQQQATQTGGRSRFAEMRRLDMDTFGAAGGQNHNQNRGGRGGQNNGGRGGQNNGGKGGFQQGGRGGGHQQGGRGGRGGGRGGRR
eukprot:31476-Pelagococcus_subviridis.AAC.25